MSTEVICSIMEIVGIVSFALSGAMVAIEKKLDLLGIVILGEVACVGGGLLRDLLIGNIPPVLFTNPTYVLTAFISIVIFIILLKANILSYERLKKSNAYDYILNLFDAIGLGAFTIVGIDLVIKAGYGDNIFLQVCMGVITGIGGGMMRDIMAGTTPYVLKKHVYACASLAGACCYVCIREILNDGISLIISAMVIIIIRLLARRYKWNFPTV